MKEDKMKKEVKTIQNANAVVFPVDFAKKCLATDVINHYIGFNSETKKDRFYIKNSITDEFLTDEQIKALTIQTKTVSKKVTKKTAKTASKEVIEERVTSNDILEKCETVTDCYNAILKALRKTELTELNMTAPLIKDLEAFNPRLEKMFKTMLDNKNIFTSPVKNKRAVFAAQETFTKDDEIESASPQILDKTLNSMF